MSFYVGMSFPFRFESGRVASVGGFKREATNEDRDSAIRQGVTQCLLTGKGARVMLGNWGAGVDRFLFSPVPALGVFIVDEVRTAVRDCCPRAQIITVGKKEDPGKGVITLDVGVRHNNLEQETVLRVAVGSGQ
jgi:phage baseplate assembly protein W